MSRPGPIQIFSHSEGDAVVEVCEADAVYAVLYQGRPIKLRRHKPDAKYLGFKYGKTSFPESGHAVGLARRLNETYNTTDFSVAVMTPGKIIYQA